MTDVPPPAPQYAAAPATYPGKTLGIVGLIVDFFVPLLGLILSIVARVQSSRAGVKNTPATVGIVLGIIFTLIYIILFIVLGIAAANLASQCASLGSGAHTVGGVLYRCP